MTGSNRRPLRCKRSAPRTLYLRRCTFALLRGPSGFVSVANGSRMFLILVWGFCGVRKGAVMKLVAYLRVSTRAQADEGFGLDVQAEAIEKWIAKHGHELVATMRDEGISGTREAVDRPGLSDALTAIEDGRAEGLVVLRDSTVWQGRSSSKRASSARCGR